jgi:hypothetical protein
MPVGFLFEVGCLSTIKLIGMEKKLFGLRMDLYFILFLITAKSI